MTPACRSFARRCPPALSPGAAPYEVHLRKSDGIEVTVELNSSFQAIKTITGFGPGPAGSGAGYGPAGSGAGSGGPPGDVRPGGTAAGSLSHVPVATG